MVSYSGRVFCGRPCFGQWVGKARSVAMHEGQEERLLDLLVKRYPECMAPWGTWPAIAREIGWDEKSTRAAAKARG